MILGTEARVRPLVELVELGTDIDLSERRTWTSLDLRDGGHFLSPRLYPTAHEDDYDVASESM